MTTRRRQAWRIARVAAYLAIISRIATAQQIGPNDSTVIAGKVVRGETAMPLVGAIVDVMGLGTMRTDSTGAFRFVGAPPGTMMVRATAIGFRPSLKMISLRAGETMRLTIALEVAAQELARVTVREDSSLTPSVRSDPTGFEARRRNQTGGLYIVAADIEKKHVVETEQVFHGIPSMYVDTGGIVVVNRGVNSTRDLEKKGDQFYHCIGAQVFIDGTPMPQPFNINQVALDRIRAIEVYRGPANTPSTLRSTRTNCGTIAIWTK
ncbi:MAG: carboxypeptidase regulatory-like domain-containing protein [Deltaproteobacteria bacterium]